MRNWTLFIVAALLASFAQAQSGKIVFINMDKAFEAFHETKSANEVINAKAKEFEAEKKTLVTEYEALDAQYNEAREDSRNPIFSRAKQDEALALADKVLLQKRELESRIRQFETDRKRQLEESLRRTRQRLVEDIRKVVADYARSQGIAAVVDTSGPTMHGFSNVIYADETVDITGDIIKLLNAAGEP